MSDEVVSPVAPPSEAAFEAAIADGSADACGEWLAGASSRDAVHAVTHLSDSQRVRLLELLPADAAAEVLESIPPTLAVESIEVLDAATAAHIIETLPSDEQADLIGELEPASAEAILDQFDDAVAAEGIRRLAAYDDEVAGGLMLREFLQFRVDQTVRDVLNDLEENAERYARFNIQYTYIVDDSGVLLGVLPLRNLLLAGRSSPLREIMIPEPVSVVDTEPLDDLAAIFREHPFVGLPATDAAGVLLGVVERSAVEHALG